MRTKSLINFLLMLGFVSFLSSCSAVNKNNGNSDDGTGGNNQRSSGNSCTVLRQHIVEFCAPGANQNQASCAAQIRACTSQGCATCVSSLTINVITGAHGVIFSEGAPVTGAVAVTEFTDKAFNFVPDEGYSIDTVLVDAASHGAVTDYTFTAIQANHSLNVTFKAGVCSLRTIEDPNGGCGANIEAVNRTISLLDGLIANTTAAIQSNNYPDDTATFNQIITWLQQCKTILQNVLNETNNVCPTLETYSAGKEKRTAMIQEIQSVESIIATNLDALSDHFKEIINQ
jgi:hypothetical protein